MPVHLVGAGPGDPALLTVRAAEVLAAADVVVADPAVAPGVVGAAPATAERLPAAPAAVLAERGRRERVVRVVAGDPFADPAALAEANALRAAGVAVEVVPGLRPAAPAGWRSGLPLAGLRVVVTRPRGQAGELSARLRDAGAEPVEVPAIEVVDPPDGGAALRAAAAGAHAYDWVAVTSANGADRFLDALRDARRLGPAKVAAIGPGTAAALARRSVVADLVPERFVAESLLEAMPDPPPGGGRVLLARAEVARDVLPDGLAARGWRVDVVPAYRTVPAHLTGAQRAAAAAAGAICFTSSSTVTSWLAAAGPGAVPPVVACIGPVTAATAREHGLAVAAEADPHTVDGLVDALVRTVTAGTVGGCDPPTSAG
ncbi:MAG TPA: uroporphyrinogen-III synthase [Acidimicrobiales bacterium]